MIEQGVFSQRRVHAQRQRSDDDDDLRRAGQQQRVADPFTDHGRHGLAAGDGLAKVAAQHAFARAIPAGFGIDQHPVVADQPVDVLHQHRLIQSELAGQTFTVGCACRLASAECRQRVTGSLHDDEQQQADDEQQRDSLQDAPE
ncbi:MAG: hypothetical protein HND48_17330 [Chloroflexi bacterium]|nr:hypothetical protein [Chloroflexota bacterium]